MKAQDNRIDKAIVQAQAQELARVQAQQAKDNSWFAKTCEAIRQVQDVGGKENMTNNGQNVNLAKSTGSIEDKISPVSCKEGGDNPPLPVRVG